MEDAGFGRRAVCATLVGMAAGSLGAVFEDAEGDVVTLGDSRRFDRPGRRRRRDGRRRVPRRSRPPLQGIGRGTCGRFSVA